MASKTKTAKKISAAKKDGRVLTQEPSGMFPELWGTWKPNVHTQEMIDMEWGQKPRRRQVCYPSHEGPQEGYRLMLEGSIYSMYTALPVTREKKGKKAKCAPSLQEQIQGLELRDHEYFSTPGDH